MRAYAPSLAVLALSIGLVAPTVAHANGRFPGARMLSAGPGDGDTTLALATTFGLALSTDGGHTWGYSCEAAIGFTGMFDPPVAVAHDGSIVVGLPTGLSVAPAPFCTYTVPATAPAIEVLDLAVDTMGSTVVAALSQAGVPNGVAISSDLGATWHMGFSQHDFYISTVEVAPGHPSRMYVSGYVAGVGSSLLRSDDGGATFVPTAGSLVGADAGSPDAGLSIANGVYIASVDATNPDTVYLRVTIEDGGSELLRSDDAGATFRVLIHTVHDMTGAAFAPDGRSMWVGSSDVFEGIARSSDGGATWQQVHCGFNTLCLRYAGGTLYACADNQLNGFAVAGSTDGGEHFAPLLQFSRLVGPDRCASSTGTAAMCGAAWPGVLATIRTDVAIDDGGVAVIDTVCAGDGGDLDARDATAPGDATDAAPADAGHAAGSRCACRAVGRTPARARGVALLIAAVAMGARRRRRRA